MRFGGMIFGKWDSPAQWAQLALDAGYSAVYFPVDYTAKDSVIDGYARAAGEAGLVIAEIGAWNNLLDAAPDKRRENRLHTVRQLELAEHVRARCCVNIAGSYSDQWDGPHRDNLTQRAFDEIVEITQDIIDSVRPVHTAYTLEPMPWMYPDSADSYAALIRAVNRKGFAAHLDPVNVISSPQKYYCSGVLIREWFDKLGPHIRSCHAKDIRIGGRLTVHLEECRPGTGELDYRAYLECLSRMDEDVCLMLEHMTQPEDYAEATKHLKALAHEMNIKL